MSRPARPYGKPALSTADLLAHLARRGLAVPDPERARVALERIGYYRRLVYMRPLQTAATTFRPGVTFDDVLRLYEFDRGLRLLCLDAIERIEVALRSAIARAVAVPHGPHFYLHLGHFERFDAFLDFLQAASRARDPGIVHYRAAYGSPETAPVWAVLEAISFGALSRLYSGLALPHRRAIARAFGLDETVLVSWFRSTNHLRNLCAHHNRLWNARLLVDRPIVARRYRDELAANDRLYARLVVVAVLLDAAAPGHDWKAGLAALLRKHPSVSLSVMGFPEDWLERRPWR